MRIYTGSMFYETLTVGIIQTILMVFAFITGWEWNKALETQSLVGPGLWSAATVLTFVAMAISIRRLLDRARASSGPTGSVEARSNHAA